MTELAFCYVDLGDDRYKVMVAEMVASARRVMPDVKITQISDNKTPMYPEVDGFYQADVACDKEMVCAFKGHFMAEFAMQCESNLILCDVDLIWQKPVDFAALVSGFPEYPLHVLVRDDMPSMPINTGLILSQPAASDLWSEYINVTDNLHANGMGGWFCDQIAAAIAWGKDCSVNFLSMSEWAYAPTGPDDDGGKDAYALHFKGNRKQWMLEYARRAQ